MRAHRRLLTAFAVLLALSLSWTGSAWAASCMTAPSTGPSGHGHHGHHAPPRESGEHGQAPACPLAAVAEPGSCLGTFRPSTALASHAAPERQTHLFSAPREARDHLRADPPFHPPRG